MTDAGRDGFNECLKMQQVIEGLQGDTRVLVASIRDCQTMVDLAAEGMETFTISPEVARELFVEPLTKEAAAAFEDAASRNNWSKNNKTLSLCSLCINLASSKYFIPYYIIVYHNLRSSDASIEINRFFGDNLA